MTRLAEVLNNPFIQEQHAVVRQGYFTWPWVRAATHQGDRAGGMVRCAIWTLPPAAGIDAAATGRGDGSGFQGFRFAGLGQDAGQARGQQGLAATG